MLVESFLAAMLFAQTLSAAGCPADDAAVLAELAADLKLVRGHDLSRAGLCIVCHTNTEGGGTPFAGGRAIKTPFGTIYSTNLTPDRDTGLGKWTDEEFLRAVKKGKHRDGSNLFPAFPYTSYTKMSDDDVLAIKAYLNSLEPVRQKNKPVEMPFPFSNRLSLTGWKLLFFRSGEYQADPAQSPSWNRGAYLVEGVSHCGECHTPRNMLGGQWRSSHLSGTKDGPEGFVAPNITPDPETGIGRWTKPELVRFLKTGRKPNGNSVSALKEEVIGHGFRYMSDADLEAIADYMRTVKPIKNDVRAK